MCGIAGGWWPLRSSVVDNSLKGALDAMHRRGPDDQGYELFEASSGVLGLAHTRLSIIDLSSGGHQPMSTSDARYSLVFNGEIYNYRELRETLRAGGCEFRTESDTEVLLMAWSQWGEACIPKLIGMFAFVIFDRSVGRLTFVRDAFGIKPLFMARDDQSVFFASELPALLRLMGKVPQLNSQRAYDYLVHGDYDTQESTFISGVCQLEPGCLQVFDTQTRVLADPQRWWKPSVLETSQLSFSQASEQLRELFLQSIRYHLRSDVSLGTALSGGVDSSAVVCAMRYVEPNAPIHTFSFLAKGSPVSEEAWIDLVNAHVGAIPHAITVEPDELAKDLDDMILAQGEPFGSTSIYAQYRVFQLAKQSGVTVTLDGQGADEILAGYRGYPGKRMRSLIETGQIGAAVSFLRNWTQWPDRPLSIGIKASLAEFTGGPVYQALRSLNGGVLQPEWLDLKALERRGVRTAYPQSQAAHYPRGRRLMAELAHSCSRNGLPGLLRHADRNSMRFSVESRVPFLTTELAEFAFSLPEHYLISPQGETKHVFRAAMRGIVPDSILDRRDKIGFATPEQDWLVRLAPQARQWLSESEPVDFIRKPEMIRKFDSIVSGREPFSWQAWRLINFTRWYSKVFLPMSS